jgi:hypothetical protein
MPYEESKTPEMENLYRRPASSSYFQDEDHRASVLMLKHRDEEDGQQQTSLWDKTFDNIEERNGDYLNRQTTAMWFKIFHNVSHIFNRILKRSDFRADLFDLKNDRDFLDFVKDAIGNETDYEKAEYKKIVEHLAMAERDDELGPLIRLYTSEIGAHKIQFYKLLNRQLALKSENDMNTAHFCDRFVYEFEMKSEQLKKWAFKGTTFRGTPLPASLIESYEKLANDEEKGAILTRTFTSTSKNKMVALDFAKPKVKEQKSVLFIYNIPTRCKTIVSVMKVSDFPKEDEVLIIPGNLFTVSRVVKESDLTEIHLDHITIEVSLFEKLRNTWRAAHQIPNIELKATSNVSRRDSLNSRRLESLNPRPNPV